MIVAPIPIGLLVLALEVIKLAVFAMPFIQPHVIRSILMIVPRVLIVVLPILVFALIVPMVVLGQSCAWKNSDGGEQRRAQ
jgi:hypothetical protein